MIDTTTAKQRWFDARWPFVRAHLPPAPARVLEIGCGPEGGFVPTMREHGYDAEGVDPGGTVRTPAYHQNEIRRTSSTERAGRRAHRLYFAAPRPTTWMKFWIGPPQRSRRAAYSSSSSGPTKGSTRRPHAGASTGCPTTASTVGCTATTNSGSPPGNPGTATCRTGPGGRACTAATRSVRRSRPAFAPGCSPTHRTSSPTCIPSAKPTNRRPSTPPRSGRRASTMSRTKPAIGVAPIGTVHNRRPDPQDPDHWGDGESTIVVAPCFGDHCLTGLDDFSHVEVVLHMAASPNARTTGSRCAPAARPTCPPEGWQLAGHTEVGGDMPRETGCRRVCVVRRVAMPPRSSVGRYERGGEGPNHQAALRNSWIGRPLVPPVSTATVWCPARPASSPAVSAAR